MPCVMISNLYTHKAFGTWLTKCVLFGQVKNPGHIGKPSKNWNDVMMSDVHHLSISCPYQVFRTSLPGEVRLAPHAPSPGWHAFQLLLLLLIFGSVQDYIKSFGQLLAELIEPDSSQAQQLLECQVQELQTLNLILGLLYPGRRKSFARSQKDDKCVASKLTVSTHADSCRADNQTFLASVLLGWKLIVLWQCSCILACCDSTFSHVACQLYPFGTSAVSVWDASCTHVTGQLYPCGTSAVSVWDASCTHVTGQLHPCGRSAVPMWHVSCTHR